MLLSKNSGDLYQESQARLKLAEFIPLLQILSDNCTIATKDLSLVQVIKLSGKNYSGVSQDELEDAFNKRKAFFDNVSDTVRLTIFNMRKRHDVAEDKIDYGNEWANKINQKQASTFTNTYRSEIYIVVRLGTEGYLQDSLGIGSAKFQNEDANLHQKRLELGGKVDEIIRILEDYSPRRLNNKDSKLNLLSFWGYITNVGKNLTIPRQSEYLGNILAISDIEFLPHKGLIKIYDDNGMRVAAILGINAYPQDTHSSLLDTLMQVRHPFTIIQQVLPQSQEKVKTKVNNMIASMQSVMNVPIASAFLHNRMAELEEVGNLVDSGESAVTNHTFSIMVYGDDEQDLEAGIRKVKSALVQNGVSIIREKLNLENAFWSQYPDHEPLNEARQYMVTTHNVADFVTLGTSYEGLNECAFGDYPVALFKTKENTQFAFTFHASSAKQAPGHTMLIGPTGGGKSVLAMHLLQNCLKFLGENQKEDNPLKILIFDSGNGLKIPTIAFGGEYINASEPKNIPLNPMQIADTPTNRMFLQQWLAMLVGGEESLSPHDKNLISRAVNENFDLPFNDRCLHSLRALFMKREDDETITFYDRIKHWLPEQDNPDKYPNSLAAYFNSNRNAIEFNKRIVALDMNNCLKHKELLAPLAGYIFHQFNETINANPAPHICFIDEMAQYLENDIFGPFILKMVREARKRNGVFFGAIQEPSVLINNPNGQAIAENLATLLVLKNSRAREEEYAALGFTDREIEWIKTPNNEREVMVKRHGGESIILNIDLSNIGELIHLYSGKLDDVAVAVKLMASDPENWVEKFLVTKTGKNS